MSAFSSPTGLKFPHAELTKIDGKPTYLSIQQSKRELFTNSAAIHSIAGSGRHGHSVLVLGVAEYNRIANLPLGGNANDWVDPAHPGPAPVFPANATSRQMTEISATYDRALKAFETYNDVEQTLKQQLLAAVDPEFVCSLQDALYGYANVTVRDLLVHLETTYGQLDQDALTANLAALEEPWEPVESMEKLWQQATYAQGVAQQGGEPITDTALVRIYRDKLTNTGVFSLDLREWDKKPLADRTWANFKTFFTEANKRRVKETTLGDMQRAFAAIGRPETPSTVGSTQPRLDTPSSALTDDTSGAKYYCWTHGLSDNKDHTSRTCTNKATGHKEDATLNNMMGGNNTIRRKRGERNDYRRQNPIQCNPQSQAQE